jgi:hypothetical protein
MRRLLGLGTRAAVAATVWLLCVAGVVAHPALGRPILTILNYSVEPSRVVAGQEFVVSVDVYNAGSEAAGNVMVTFPGGTFLPVGGAGHLLGHLGVGQTAVVSQSMRVPAGLASGTYSLEVELSATDEPGNRYDYPQTIGVEAVSVGSGRPLLLIESAETDPSLLAPGTPFDLTLRLANRGARTASSVLVAADSELVVPASGGSVVSLEWIGVGEGVTATLPLILGEVPHSGRVGLVLSLEYGDYSGGTYADSQEIGLQVSTALSGRPQLIVTGYRTVPETIAPGDSFALTLEVSNLSGGDAERLVLTLGGEGGAGLAPFAPLYSSNVKFVPSLPAGGNVEVTQHLVADGSVGPGAHTIPVGLGFLDQHGAAHSETQLISLLVLHRPHLEIGLYRPLELVETAIPFELPVEVTNVGKATLNVNTLEVTSSDLTILEGSLYLGPLDPGTSGSLEAVAVAEAGGTAEVVVNVHYLDDFNQPCVLSETIELEVREPQVVEPTPESEGEAGEDGGFLDVLLRLVRGLLGLGS